MRFALLVTVLAASPTAAQQPKPFPFGEEQTVDITQNAPRGPSNWFAGIVMLPANETYRVRITPAKGAQAETWVRVISADELSTRGKTPAQWAAAEESPGDTPETDYVTRSNPSGKVVGIQLLFKSTGTYHYTISKYAPPPLNEEQTVEITQNSPKGGANWYLVQMVLPNDQYRVRVSPDKGAQALTWVRIVTDDEYSTLGKAAQHFVAFEETDGETTQTDYTMKARPAGKRVCVQILFKSTGTYHYTITKVGDDTPPKKAGAGVRGGDKDETIRQLQAENADLKKQLGDLKSQLADQKKQLDTIIELLKKK